ncbi:MAG TPA: glycosyltransferase family 9 protein, partial [Candidatus Limnocylindrales bacterium]|nr:glycosyltransferase family 9 protein [Candidatus Limnocylindrales bacterium]
MTRREIVVVRALALGDLLCAVPFLRALRGRFPDARVTLVGLPWAAALVDRFSDYLDAFVPFPGWPGIPETPPDARRAERFLRASRRHPADLAIQAHGSGRHINSFVAALGARGAAGFHPPGQPAPDGGPWLPYPTDRPEIRRLLALAAALGADAGDERLEWPLREDDDEAVAAALAPDRLQPGDFAVVHPGASRLVGRWPAARFAAVADAISRRGLRIVLTGSLGETATTAEVAARMSAPALDLAGRTSLGPLAAVLAGARLLVSNDTGVAHLAEAVGTPTVRIFRASDPRRWGPLREDRHRALVPPDLGGRCVEAGRPGHPDCAAARCVAGGADPAPSSS